jgi:Amt family ammonium transporter
MCLQPWAALIIGFFAGGVYVFASWFVLHVLKVDDPLEAIAVHAFCGAYGLIATALFAHKPNVASALSDDNAKSGYGVSCFF